MSDTTSRDETVEALRHALEWALPLAERALKDERRHRVRYGYIGITQAEHDELEYARTILGKVKGGAR